MRTANIFSKHIGSTSYDMFKQAIVIWRGKNPQK